MAIEDLYTEIITEHSRSLRNRKPLENPTIEIKGVNPSCGDEISLQLQVQNGVVTSAAYLGEGCAISQASTSIMIDLIKNKTVKEALRLGENFIGMIKGTVTQQPQLDELEEAVALQGISRMPARVKCAVLSWHTLKEALESKK